MHTVRSSVNVVNPNCYWCFFLKVMLKAGKYDSVYGIFEKMKRIGEALKAVTYKGVTNVPSVTYFLVSRIY